MNTPLLTVARALAWAQARGLARLDAQLLLLHALGREGANRAWLIAHDNDAMDAAQQHQFEALCTRRGRGEPLAYLVGHKEFHGLPLRVDARVLVPRPDTETLVDWALECAEGMDSPRIIDLGTGSGAIALALAHRRPDARVEAVDRSAEALAVAAENALALGLRLPLRQASWLDGAAGDWNLILSNPPYIAEGDPHLPDLVHEPRSALVSGADGLDDIRLIVAQAPRHLAPGGWLLLEHGFDQAEAVRVLLREAGLVQVHSRRDLAGVERCSGGQRPA
ncbi:peptide chain release factor N(5)-glutamine methyltransferase [Ramlibacter rhizophilus]|uniref:Release factor glutamine methyltransferase n=1 Tax=Ramlibacter rhizophilus TaxID=1781167 RepID=A0A4Z0BRX5_9BURK|nr:peptide chain release factor N(5)-glutamine methyltransferase [Ramlibacter rhizophilus]TFZ01581.1 peptide chain release factor N(5)-glutamine methyltransferase [Ramlibacter rhizophilus]